MVLRSTFSILFWRQESPVVSAFSCTVASQFFDHLCDPSLDPCLSTTFLWSRDQTWPKELGRSISLRFLFKKCEWEGRWGEVGLAEGTGDWQRWVWEKELRMGRCGFRRRKVCVCAGECDRSKNSSSGDDFPMEVLKMRWSIFQRVLGWKKAVIQECCSGVHMAWRKGRRPHRGLICHPVLEGRSATKPLGVCARSHMICPDLEDLTLLG